MKKCLTLGSAVMIIALFPAVSFAASMNSGSNVSVEGTTPAQGNAYAVGGTVTATGLVNGDFLVAGGTIISSAEVSGDIMAAGGAVTMVGITAQDVRVAGGTVTIGGALSGELVAAGGTVIVSPGTSIVKDSYVGAGTVNFSGNEAGNLNLVGGNIYFDGTVGGNLTISRAQKITIGPNAVIKGMFEYSAPTTATIEGGSQIAGTPVFHEIQADGKASGWPAGVVLGIFTLWWFVKFLTVLTGAYLLWYIFRNDSVAILDKARFRYGRSLLFGFLFFVVVPIAAIIAFITVVGIIPGVVVLLAYAAIITLAAPLAMLFAGAILWRRNANLRWYHILLGAAVMSIAILIPFIGWIAYGLVYLGALGACVSVLREKFMQK